MPRDIEVYSAKLAAIVPGNGDVSVFWDVDFHVSKGTYIRALARDLGKELGVGGYLTRLRRTRDRRFDRLPRPCGRASTDESGPSDAR